MSSLYRRYRPSQFNDVVGQDHIRLSLESALKKNMIAHAYLFSGPRGSGKTSVARLFAKAINCPERGKKAEACDVCAVCQEIKSARAIDVIEIDAASNRGIDEIRELRDRIAFAPTSLKYKVYIIDEVHMLTKEAFNALLKTLEEPPAHAIFILATTELHKVPDTIISRCQRYQFHRAAETDLRSVLLAVAKKEAIALEEEAAQLLAERADGSFRDALTLLGSVSNQGQLSAPSLRQLLGLPTEQTVSQVLELITAGQARELAEFLQTQLTEGRDLAVLVKQLCDRLKKSIFVPGSSELSLEKATWLLEQCLVALSRARTSSDPTATLIARLLALAVEGNVSPAVAEAPLTNPASQSVTDIQKKESSVPAPKTSPAVDAVAEKSTQVDLSSSDFWGAFLQEIKQHNHALYMLVRSAKLIDLNQEKLVLAVKFRFYSERLFETKNRKIVEQAASKVGARPLRLECEVKSEMEEPNKAEAEIMNAVVDVFELEEVAS